MKKSIKMQILVTISLLGLFQQNQYALDIDEKFIASSIAAGITGLAAAKFKISGYGILASSLTAYKLVNPDKCALDIQPKTPYLQEWYNNDLTQKYPESKFNTKKLLIGFQTCADAKNIYMEADITPRLESICKKKITGEKLSEENAQLMSKVEWTLLHEATHVNNNDSYSHATFNVGVLTGLELGYQKYKKSQTVAPAIHSTSWTQSAWKLTNSLPKRAGILAIMLFASTIPTKAYSRHCETRADAFANQHADMNALKASVLYYKAHSQINNIKKYETETPLFFQTHPTIASRIQNIEDEIERREAKNK